MIRNRKYILLQIIAVAIISVPFILDDKYIFHIAVMSGIYMILSMSLNVQLGFTGLFSFGHAAFYGIGAYASALLTRDLGLPFVAAFILSGLFTAFIGTLIALPALRLKGIFLAIGTMCFNEIFCLLSTNLESLTGGPAGLPDIPVPSVFGLEITQPKDYYILITLLVLVTYKVFDNLIKSRHGRALTSIRDDEIAARAIGVNITNYKIKVFAITAFFAGLSGSFFAHYLSYISPSNFALSESFNLMAMIALGGIGNLPGSIVGAGILVIIPEVFRFLQDYRELIYGLTIVLIVLLLPQGIIGWISGLLHRQQTSQDLAGSPKKFSVETILHRI